MHLTPLDWAYNSKGAARQAKHTAVTWGLQMTTIWEMS
jgi:hypothetical protein